MPSGYADQEDPLSGLVTRGEWRQVWPSFNENNYSIDLGCRGTRQAQEIENYFRGFYGISCIAIARKHFQVMLLTFIVYAVPCFQYCV